MIDINYIIRHIQNIFSKSISSPDYIRVNEQKTSLESKPYRFIASWKEPSKKKPFLGKYHLDSIGISYTYDTIAFIKGTGEGLCPFHLGQAICVALIGKTNIDEDEENNCFVYPAIHEKDICHKAELLTQGKQQLIQTNDKSFLQKLIIEISKNVSIYVESNNDDNALWSAGMCSYIYPMGLFARISTSNLMTIHVGDCVIFRWRGSKLEQIVPHSLDIQNITNEEYETYMSSQSTKFLIGDDVIPKVLNHPLQPHDVYLFCNSIFVSHIDLKELLILLRNSTKLSEREQIVSISKELIKMAWESTGYPHSLGCGICWLLWDGVPM